MNVIRARHPTARVETSRNQEKREDLMGVPPTTGRERLARHVPHSRTGGSVNRMMARGGGRGSDTRRSRRDRRTALGRPLLPAWDGYWKNGLVVVAVMYFFITLRAHDAIPFIGKLRPSLLTMVLGLFFLYSRSAPRVRKLALADRSVRQTAAYVAWIGVTMPFALWPGEAFQWFRVALVGAAVLIACAFVRPSRANAYALQRLMVWGGGAMAAVAILKGDNEHGRLLFGNLYDPNDFGSLLAALIILGVGLFLRARGRDKWISLAAVAPMAVAMLATGSRGVLVGFGLGVILLTMGYRGKRLAIVLVGLTVGTFGAFTQVDTETRERLLSVFALENDYNFTENTGRMAIWTRGMRYVQSRPLFGAGAGNFPMADGHYYELLGQPGKWQAAHNTYVQAAVELGVPGLILLTLLYGTGLKRAARYWRPRKWLRPYDGHMPELLAAFVSYATAAFFLSHAYMVIQFFVIGLILVNDRSLHAARPSRRRAAANRPAMASPPPSRGA